MPTERATRPRRERITWEIQIQVAIAIRRTMMVMTKMVMTKMVMAVMIDDPDVSGDGHHERNPDSLPVLLTWYHSHQFLAN